MFTGRAKYVLLKHHCQFAARWHGNLACIVNRFYSSCAGTGRLLRASVTHIDRSIPKSQSREPVSEINVQRAKQGPPPVTGPMQNPTLGQMFWGWTDSYPAHEKAGAAHAPTGSQKSRRSSRGHCQAAYRLTDFRSPPTCEVNSEGGALCIYSPKCSHRSFASDEPIESKY